ncbi:hypothetical protein [Streptomyces sp. NPDC046859]|uniref:hypothetical protein n=1 Tax=Streptomyces sp. NPDC046859 TaxID=3155734 RepID=UPI0033FEC7ED
MTSPADELRAAAHRLRDVAPNITGHLAGLADPVADWLDLFANTEFDPEASIQVTDRSHECALAVARAINGTEQP